MIGWIRIGICVLCCLVIAGAIAPAQSQPRVILIHTYRSPSASRSKSRGNEQMKWFMQQEEMRCQGARSPCDQLPIKQPR